MYVFVYYPLHKLFCGYLNEFYNEESSQIGKVRMVEPKEELNSLKLPKKKKIVNIHDLQMAQILMITSVCQFSQWI